MAQPGDMAPYYNDTGISSDTDQGAANFDGDGFSYSEQALAAQGVTLGGAVTADGVQYTFPSAAVGTPDNVTAGGQTIKVLPVSGATTIGFLGSATNGPSTGQLTITLHRRQQPDGDARLQRLDAERQRLTAVVRQRRGRQHAATATPSAGRRRRSTPTCCRPASR